MNNSYNNYGQILHRNLIELFEYELSYHDLKKYNENLNDTSKLEVFYNYYDTERPNYDYEIFKMTPVMKIYIRINDEVIYSHVYNKDYYGKMVRLLHHMTPIEKLIISKNEDMEELVYN